MNEEKEEEVMRDVEAERCAEKNNLLSEFCVRRGKHATVARAASNKNRETQNRRTTLRLIRFSFTFTCEYLYFLFIPFTFFSNSIPRDRAHVRPPIDRREIVRRFYFIF